MTEDPTLDFEDLVHRIGSDKEFLLGLLNEFVTGLPGDLAELEQIVAGGDAEAVVFKAHSIKGNAANLSAKEFARLALIAEMAGKEGKLGEVEAVIPALREEAGRLKQAVAEVTQ